MTGDVRANVGQVRASRTGRRILGVFWSLVGVALVGVGWYVLPVVSVVIVPEIEEVQVAADVRIDTALTEPLLAVGNIPGRLITDEVQRGGLAAAGFEVLSVGDVEVAYDRTHVSSLVQRKVAEILAEEFIEVPDSLSFHLSTPVASGNGRSFTAVVQAKVLAYRPMPVSLWRSHLAGMPISEAWGYLESQKGVATVMIRVQPNFLARLSHKIPKNPSSLTLTLDVEGKTSILE